MTLERSRLRIHKSPRASAATTATTPRRNPKRINTETITMSKLFEFLNLTMRWSKIETDPEEGIDESVGWEDAQMKNEGSQGIRCCNNNKQCQMPSSFVFFFLFPFFFFPFLSVSWFFCCLVLIFCCLITVGKIKSKGERGVFVLWRVIGTWVDVRIITVTKWVDFINAVFFFQNFCVRSKSGTWRI